MNAADGCANVHVGRSPDGITSIGIDAFGVVLLLVLAVLAAAAVSK